MNTTTLDEIWKVYQGDDEMFSSSFKEKLDIIKDFQSSRSQVWFRGHSNSNYSLKSGLFRLDYSNIEDFLNTERSYYTMFKNYGYSLHQTDSWDLVYLMQHHGVKTRLLDWTESFAVALYFAFKDWKLETECSVWVLDPLLLNENLFGKREYIFPSRTEHFEDFLYGNNINQYSVALFPQRNNSRIIAQQGTFIIQGNSLTSIDKELLNSKEYLFRMDFGIEHAEDIRHFLKLCGVNHLTLFPDLDGLAKYVVEEDMKISSTVIRVRP